MSAAGSAEREPLPRTSSAASTARRRTAGASSANAATTSSVVSAPQAGQGAERRRPARPGRDRPGRGGRRPRHPGGRPGRRRGGGARRGGRGQHPWQHRRSPTSSMSDPDATADGGPATTPPLPPPPPPRGGGARRRPEADGLDGPPAGRRPPGAPLALRARRLRGAGHAGGHHRRAQIRQLLRDHAGERDAGRPVHRGAAGGQPSAHRPDPADRRVRVAAQRAQLPAVPLLRLERRDLLEPGPARPVDEPDASSSTRATWRWRRPSRSPRRPRCPTSATR